jgi:hypothetical protein
MFRSDFCEFPSKARVTDQADGTKFEQFSRCSCDACLEFESEFLSAYFLLLCNVSERQDMLTVVKVRVTDSNHSIVKDTCDSRMVSLVQLKALVKDYLPISSVLRALILSEPDFLPRHEALVKLLVYVQLLGQELGRS